MKPERVLCLYSGENIMDPSRGLFMVHLGFTSRWIGPSMTGGHIAYGLLKE